MATAKPPFIPEPPLEIGIAQYPTPNVPDYYTRDGHIILVEKVSIEKGTYNPQPLDGSVIYDKRDANDWPTNLYLVFQQTEPTGKFVFNYWANDRTLASQDPWNYGLAYSLNHPDYKIVTRTYITPREDYAPVALGSIDPVFGGTAIISKQEMAELPDDNPLRSRYVQVQRVYETIPSSIITGKRVTERGDIETLDTQVVVAGTSPDADGLLVTQTAIESIDAVKSKRTKGSVTSYSTLTTKAKRAGLLGEVSVSDDIVAPATDPDALTTSIIDSTVEAISATKSRKRTTTSSGPSSLSGKSTKSGLLGNATTTESIVASGSSADPVSISVIQSEVTPIDSAKSKKTTVESSGPTSLTAEKISERGDTQTITKSIVSSNTGVTTDDLLLVSSQVDEIDAVKSQKTDVTVASYASLTTRSNKSGLLGEVSVSDDIVEPSESPDALSETVIDSTVEAISATKSRKRTTTATGPTSLSGLQNKAGLLGSSSIVESIVESGENADALSLSVVSSEVVSIDSAKSKKRTETASGPTSLTGKVMSEFGIASVTDSIVSSGSSVSPSRTTIKAQVDSIDAAKSKSTLINYDATEVLDGYQYDADLGLVVHTTKELIAAGTSPLGPTNGLIAYKDEPLNAWQSIRIQSKISSLPPQRNEYKTGAYASPNLLTGFTTSFFAFPDGQLQFNATPVMRAERSYQTAFRYETTYQYNQPTEPSSILFDPVSIHVIYSGFFFSIDIPNCLTDNGFSLSVNTGLNNATTERYGVYSETYTVPTSSTTASQYNEKIGTYALISYEVDYWKANIWRIAKQYVLLK